MLGILFEVCYRAGGNVVEGSCVGARGGITSAWDAPWQQIAEALAPSIIAAFVIGVLAWR
jgi:hypothetical protein